MLHPSPGVGLGADFVRTFATRSLSVGVRRP